MRGLGYELEGAILDIERTGECDAVSLRTIKRVRNALMRAKPVAYFDPRDVMPEYQDGSDAFLVRREPGASRNAPLYVQPKQ